MEQKEEMYMTLYEYLGKGTKSTNIGREVTAAAIKQNLVIKYRPLPKEMQTPEYSQVQTYPISFLDEYFANNLDIDTTPFVRRSSLTVLQQQIQDLQFKYDILIKQLDTNVTNSNEHHDDDLPF
jgi:hypothetical protein